MRFSLIICTYMRSKPILDLLKSVDKQKLYPNEILVVDGSTDKETERVLKENVFNSLKYYKVEEEHRGLTKQRNYGINLVDESSEIVCFLDDDIILSENYFKELIYTYKEKKDALAIGGYIANEIEWKKELAEKNNNKFFFDGWSRKEPSRFKLRQRFNLLPDAAPGFMPAFSHGRSVSFLPPSNKVYEVEQIMGGVSSYRKEVFEKLRFSSYFEGYGLYEDADFSLRLAKQGKLYINSKAKLEHHHEESGRPNMFKYGKMVIRNGWYVWRVKYPNPSLKSRIKWNATAFLLTLIRFTNVINTNKKKAAFLESSGRVFGWLSLIFNKPKVES